MKDRVPTEVLGNGALRMEQFDADGNSLGYVYLKRADAPSEEGTPYSKNAVLTDETASALRLDASENPTANDAFAKIAERLLSGGTVETFAIPSMGTNESHMVTLAKPLSNAAYVWCGRTSATSTVKWNVTGEFTYCNITGYFITDNAILDRGVLDSGSAPDFVDTASVNSIQFKRGNVAGTSEAFNMYVLWR